MFMLNVQCHAFASFVALCDKASCITHSKTVQNRSCDCGKRNRTTATTKIQYQHTHNCVVLSQFIHRNHERGTTALPSNTHCHLQHVYKWPGFEKYRWHTQNLILNITNYIWYGQHFHLTTVFVWHFQKKFQCARKFQFEN